MNNIIDFQKKADEKIIKQLYLELRPDILKCLRVVELGRLAGLSDDELWKSTKAPGEKNGVNPQARQLVEGILHIIIYGKEPPSK